MKTWRKLTAWLLVLALMIQSAPIPAAAVIWDLSRTQNTESLPLETEAVQEESFSPPEQIAAPQEPTAPAAAEQMSGQIDIEEHVPIQMSAAQPMAVAQDFAWTLDNGVLTITGNGEMPGWSSGSAPWYSQRSEITALVVEEGITSVGSYAFYGCKALASAELPESLTDIEQYAFFNCDALASIVLPEGLTTIGPYAFNYCESLTEVELPESLTTMAQYAFSGCTSLAAVTLPGGLTSISTCAFYNCKALSRVAFSGELPYIGYAMFSGCTALTEVVLPDSVTSIRGEAFSGCTALAAVKLPASLVSIDQKAFYRCTVLENIELPEGLTSIGQEAFCNCAALTGVVLPQSLTTLGISAFQECRALTDLTLSGSLTEIGHSVFRNCTSLTNVEFPNGMTAIGDSMFYNCTSLKETVLPQTLATIGGSAFYNCTALTEVVLPQSVTSIGYESFCRCTAMTDLTLSASLTEFGLYAFMDCTALTNVVCPDGLTAIGYSMFTNCTALTGIELPDGLSAIESYSFSGCTGLREVQLPDSLTTIGNDAFSDCTSLTGITIPRGVTSIGAYAFQDCTSLTDVVLSESLTELKSAVFWGCSALAGIELPQSLTAIGERAFEGCTALTKIGIPEGVTRIEKSTFRGCESLTDLVLPGNLSVIGELAFYNCGSLSAVELPESLETIGDTAFMYCESLMSLTIPEGVTTLGKSAFNRCTGLTTVELPASLTDIGSYCFYLCSSLEEVELPAGLTTIESYVFNGCTALASLGLPEGLVSIGECAFYGCTALEEVAFPDSLSSLGTSAFYGCSALSGVVFPESLTQISEKAFYKCTSLAAVEFPASLTGIGSSAFYGCTALTDVEFPEGMTTIGGSAFYGCTALETVIFSDSLTSIGSAAFRNCTALTELMLPAGLTSIGSGAFEGCTALLDVTFPEGLTALGSSAFEGCCSLVTVALPDSLSSIDGFVFQNCSSLTDVAFPTGLTTIGNNAFDDCTALTWVELPEGLTEIGSGAFMDCTALTGIELPDSLTDIGNGVFYDCTALIGIELPVGVTRIEENVFRNCTALTSVGLPDGLISVGEAAFRSCGALELTALPASLTTIDEYAFCSCSSLALAALPASLTTIGSYAFAGCGGLTLTRLPDSLVTIGSYAFSGCSGLTLTGLPDGLTGAGRGTFSGCTGLTRMELPASLKRIDWELFSGCTGLTEVLLPEGLTSLEYRAFMDCTSLTTAELPETLTYIGSEAFYNCTALTDIRIPDGVTYIESKTFYNCDSLTEITLPEGVTGIQHMAFASCDALEKVVIPMSTDFINTAFLGSPVTIYGYAGSYAEQYAGDNGHPFVSLGRFGAPVVSVLVRDDSGSVITDGFRLEWYEDGELIGSGDVLRVQESGHTFSCRILLEEELLTAYYPPREIVFEAGEEDMTLECVLRSIPKITLTGRILGADGAGLAGTVRITQAFHETLTQELTIVTAADGTFSTEAAVVPTTLLFRADGYRDQSLSPILTGLTGTCALEDVTLTGLPEARVVLELLRQDAVRPGETASQTRLTGLEGWNFTVTNVTQNREITDFTVQEPYLLPAEGFAQPGDILRICAEEPESGIRCEPVEVSLNEVAAGRCVLIFQQQGSFVLERIDGKPQARILIFDAEGNMVSEDLTYQSWRSMDLPAGNYRAVLIEPTQLLGSVLQLSVLEEYGLRAGTDYALLDVAVEDELITVIDQVTIPALDESNLFYTDPDQTAVTLNTTSTYVGKYVLLRVEYALKAEHAASEETVYIRLPDGLEPADSSLTVDNEKTTFLVEDNTIRIKTDKPQAVIRLYLLGRETGSFPVDADLSFALEGDAVTQPLGHAQLQLSAATFRLPERTSFHDVPITGVAVPNSTISVYDGETLVGTARSNGAGAWYVKPKLDNPYSYVQHSIRIGVKHENLETEVYSEPELLIYDAEHVEPVKVTMYVGGRATVFDFRDPTNEPSYIMDRTNLGFMVELNRSDDPMIDKVYVITAPAGGRTTYVECTYDAEKNIWVGGHDYSVHDAPSSLDVLVVMKEEVVPPAIDGEMVEDLEDLLEEIEAELDRELEEKREEIINSIVLPPFDDMTIDELISYTEEVQNDTENVLTDTENTFRKELEAEGVVIEQTDNGVRISDGTMGVLYREETLEQVNQDALKRDGYTPIEIPGKEPVYIRNEGGIVEAVDPASKMKVICELESFMEDNVDFTDPSSLMAYRGMMDNTVQIVNGKWEDLQKFYDHHWKKAVGNDFRTQISMQKLDEKIFDLKRADANPYLIQTYEKCYDDLKFRQTLQSRYADDMWKQYRKYQMAESFGKGCDAFSLVMSVKSMGETLNKGATLRLVHSSLAASCADNEEYQTLSREIRVLNTSMNVAAGCGVLIDTVSLVATGIAPPAGLVLGVMSFGAQKFAEHNHNQEYSRIGSRLKTLDCDGDGIPDYLEYADDLAMQMSKYVTIDPSGYVYEAVPSNRLEGVKAEVYYQGYPLDEFGVPSEEPADILWDAAFYDQVNPQYTDSEGRYHWDVPFGLWLVKYSKEGYLDTDSRNDPAADEDGYLPVPPPQLEVNVGMISTASPVVESLNVYQDQVQIIFSQYMKPAQIELSVACGGKTVTGTLEPANAEFNEEQTERFASVFNFIPNEPLSGTAAVTISEAINYAGTAMTEVYTEAKSVTIRPRALSMTAEAVVPYGGELELEVRILPAAAGANKTLTVVTDAPGLVDVAEQTITTDENGAAIVTIIGSLPTSAEVTVQLDGTDLRSRAQIRVQLQKEDVCGIVTADIPNGATVAPGALLELYTATVGAEIYYTLDGSCPCVTDSPSRIRYDGPITLNEDTFLIAYAVKEGLEDSPTAGFIYKICTHPDALLENDRKATCTDDGYTGDVVCDDCGMVIEQGSVVPALGHSYGDWTVIQEPTTTEDGLEERSCTRCGHTEQHSIAKLDNPFTDVQPGSFYYEPVMWAIENGITNGTSANTFGPNDQCMRAHVVTFLWRAVGSPEPTRTDNPFVDVKPTDFYYKPVLWALEKGITSGMDATHFGPTSYCNRAQVVTFLYRTMGSPELESMDNPFDDVQAGAFYEKPVLWAVQNGITNGLSATGFGPNSICNRAQIVTFLYRAFVD